MALPVQLRDPNFPPDLCIAPSSSKYRQRCGGSDVRSRTGSGECGGTTSAGEAKERRNWDEDDSEDIERWGIAGRIWEAAYALRLYLQPPGTIILPSYLTKPSLSQAHLDFDPPCSIFSVPLSNRPYRNAVTALELGAGQGYVGLHLARALSTAPCNTQSFSARHRVVLTDLEEVGPLLHRNSITAGFSEAAPLRGTAVAGGDVALTTKTDQKVSGVEVLVRTLAWGNSADGERILAELERGQAYKTSKAGEPSLTHIICSDLVFFPHLLAPLLRSLIQLTQPRPWASCTEELPPTMDMSATPEVIISYKIRSLTKEQPFWTAFGRWFDYEAVGCRSVSPASHARETLNGDCVDGRQGHWHRFGSPSSPYHPTALLQRGDNTTTGDQDHGPAPSSTSFPAQGETNAEDIFVFVARRRAESIGWAVPESDAQLLSWSPPRVSQEQDRTTLSETGRGGVKGEGTFEVMLLGAIELD